MAGGAPRETLDEVLLPLEWLQCCGKLDLETVAFKKSLVFLACSGRLFFLASFFESCGVLVCDRLSEVLETVSARFPFFDLGFCCSLSRSGIS